MTTLVLLPGMDGTGELFAPFVSALDKRIRTIVIRYPASDPLTYQQLLSRVREALPKDDPFFLLGESFSGPIAVSIAAEMPEGLQGLILCASFVRSPMPRLRFLRSVAGLISVTSIPERILSFPLLGRFSTRQLCKLLSGTIAQVAPQVFRVRAREVLNVDVSAAAKQIRIPTLYLQATEDKLVGMRATDLVQKHIPHIRVARLEAPHMLLQVAHVEAARVVEAFVADLYGTL
ncbi:MAG TPA: alpha/beta fold hydrolase [Noviherbaspirillum sp.]|nr:alpha/beta fold hydrolase [Noviherbaspirillum sp.]